MKAYIKTYNIKKLHRQLQSISGDISKRAGKKIYKGDQMVQRNYKTITQQDSGFYYWRALR